MTDIIKTVDNIGKNLYLQRHNIVSSVTDLINLCIKAAGGQPIKIHSAVARRIGRHEVEVTINEFVFVHHFTKKGSDKIHQTIRYMDGHNIEIKHLVEDNDNIDLELRTTILELREEISHACIHLTEKEKCMDAWSPFMTYVVSKQISESDPSQLSKHIP